MTGGVINWAGNIAFEPARLHRPSCVEQLQAIVADADRVRVLGTGHSFNRIADTPEDLVSIADLPPFMIIDADQSTVTVAGGIRYGMLAQYLHANGFALHNLGSLPHISIAGATATGTHGSGDANGNLATAVAAVELVGPSGELTRLRRGDDGFAGAVVALGALGVVTRMTLDIAPTYEVRQIVYEHLPRAHLDAHWDELSTSGYSVSLFTDWNGPTVNQVWLKRRSSEPAPPDLFGARPASGPRHPVPGMSTVSCTEQGDVPGPWHMRLPHFRLDFMPSSGEELQTEYFVAREHAVEAFAAIERVRHLVTPVLQIAEIRTIAADELWLSPHYRRDSVALHFTWVRDTEAVLPVTAAIEEQLAPFAPRPHWGKVFTMPPELVRERYDRLPDFTSLRARLDPAGKFGNDFIDRYV